jgi:hypothetical protein
MSLMAYSNHHEALHQARAPGGALGIVSPAAQMSSPNLYDLGSVTDIDGNTVELSLFKARPPSSAAQPP